MSFSFVSSAGTWNQFVGVEVVEDGFANFGLVGPGLTSASFKLAGLVGSGQGADKGSDDVSEG